MSLRQLLGNGIAAAYFPNATDCSGPYGVNETNYDGRWGQDSNHCALEHWLWWVAQIILFLGYTLFGGLSTTYGLHRYRSQGKFRLTMVLAFLILAIWGGAFGMALEQMIFAVGLILINLWHLTMCILFDKTISVNPYLMNLYHKMFDHDNINLEDVDFYNLVQEKAFLKTFQRGQFYCHEHDKPNQLSILLHGKMSIYKHDDYQRKDIHLRHESTHHQRIVAGEDHDHHGAYVGTVYPYEFIDSYEWLSMQGAGGSEGHGEHQMYQVSIKVSEDEGVDEAVILTWKKPMLEAVFKFDDAKEQMEHIQKKLRPEVNFDDYDEHDTWVTQEMYQEFKDRIDAAYADESDHVLITNIPAVMFVWDIKDLKRLMLADPHVESHLSTILRGDITYKLDNAELDGLATRVCGVRTQAVGDHEVRACNINPE